ncbi:AAA family ATPase [Nocardia asteroides]|uniref:AAA family ATPase n=1 Tax=Nocardia asteroides TaxID=1824 RepID=UPI001E2967FF|nr:AAA family ATPase [Nocardia asteroides]UGT64141.1 AAA family ATPase [Nocardia asteroides]
MRTETDDATGSLARLLEDGPAADPEVVAVVRTALDDIDQPAAAAGAPRHDGIYLRGIAVRGFRGIGPESVLRLSPGPGLTLVVGRNGSGKSSFAEAAELALTGANRRWEGRSAAWREGWRNLHAPGETRIALDLLTAGSPAEILVRAAWPAEAELTAPEWTEQRGAADPAPFDVETWSALLALHRPFLSYSELGSLIDGRPSDLFDALHRLLGLDELTAAQERIRARRLTLERAARASRALRTELAGALERTADTRAVELAALLRTPDPEVAAVEAALTGADDTADVAGLRGLVRLAVPAPVVVRAAVQRLERAGAEVARYATGNAEADLRTLELLRRARSHAGDADCVCPLCGAGQLDAAWRAATDIAVGELAARVAGLAEARAELRRAAAALRSLPQPVPDELVAPGRRPVDTAAVARAWTRWAALRFDDGADDDPALPERVRTAYTRLVDELEHVRRGTRTELERLDEVWAPLVPRLTAWITGARLVEADSAELRTVKRAEEWLKAAAGILRDERMAPLQETARWVWQTLRQQSNVELGAVRLQGSAGTARRVLLDVTVDEVDGAALGVMSQGELHALGLSLFLPRATAERSPFRFVLIDDPVQAMDPAKVDGLATVLAEVARSRQVVVFTHDERLAEAVRRMQLDARVLEVQRRERSVVEVRTVSDPVRRYLADARSLMHTRQLPPAIATELVATCCRSALEAAGLARARRTLLAGGMGHAEVERRVSAAQTTRAMVALAVMGVDGKVDDLNAHLAATEGGWAVDVLRDATAGAHVPIDRGMRALIADTERLIARLAADLDGSADRPPGRRAAASNGGGQRAEARTRGRAGSVQPEPPGGRQRQDRRPSAEKNGGAAGDRGGRAGGQQGRSDAGERGDNGAPRRRPSPPRAR